MNPSTVQVELEEWVSVNRELRQHGLPSVKVLHPSKMQGMSDVVGLEPSNAKNLRESLLTLMRDCQRRQELVQELIITNNQLKSDLSQQISVTERFEDQCRDLKALLDNSKDRVEELEDEQYNSSSLQHEEEDKLRNTKNILLEKYRQLQQRCNLQTEEMERLKKKIKRMTDEDEKRMVRQNQVFQDFRKRATKAHTAVDERLMDIIDSYERQLYNMRKETDALRDSVDSSNHIPPLHDPTFDVDDATPNYKALIKSYEKQLQQCRKTIRALEENTELMKLEMESRPDLKEYRAAQQRLKILEKLIKKHQIALPGEKTKSNLDIMKQKYSTHIEDIDFLPLPHCQSYIKLICDKANVKDVEDVVGHFQKYEKIVDAYVKLEQFTKDVIDSLDTPGLPLPPSQIKGAHEEKCHEVYCEKTWRHVLPTLEFWVQQLLLLKELQQAVNRLTAQARPWSNDMLTGDVTVMQLIHAVNSLVENEDSTSSDRPSLPVLLAIVEHFQKLFDVSKISGIFPRMNDIYTKLGQVYNVQNTLKALLGLDGHANSNAIVDAVATLCEVQHNTTTEQLRQLLQVQDLDSVIKKLEHYEEFVPTFHKITSKLMEILEIKQLDQLVPSVHALKLLAG